MRLIYLILLLLAIQVIGLAKTIKVPGDYATIQEAIDVAVTGDTVLVDPGTYYENIEFKDQQITLKSSAGAPATVIDGQKIRMVVSFPIDQIGSGTMIDGFTITNGNHPAGAGINTGHSGPTISDNIITGNSGKDGAGIYSFPTTGNLTIINNLICNNTGSNGGAIYCALDPALIRGNTIVDNSCGGFGGAIFCKDGNSSLIVDNVIANNHAGHSGGAFGIYYSGTTPTIANNLIHHNTATYDGGAFYIYQNGEPMIQGNTISYNQAGRRGGAMYTSNAEAAYVFSNLIHNNTAVEGGGGIHTNSSYCEIINNTLVNNSTQQGSGGGLHLLNGNALIVNTILWKNMAPIGKEIAVVPNSNPSYVYLHHSNVQGGAGSISVTPPSVLITGQGIIDADPQFVDEGEEDYHILFLSPCKDTGDNQAVMGNEDFEGDPRIAYGTVDMGADEFDTHLYWTGDATPGGNVSLKFVGLPNTARVGLFIGSGLLDPPLPSMWGEWYLQFPVMGPLTLAPIPLNGVEVLSGALPGMPPAPYTISMQAMIGNKLTNFNFIDVE